MVVVYISDEGKYWKDKDKFWTMDTITNETREATPEFRKKIDEGKNFVSYFMDSKLKKKTDAKIIPALNKNDKDWIEVVDGSEGAGKSYYAFQRARYVDPTFNLDRVVFTPQEFKDAIFKASKGQAIVYDEAFSGLSSRSSLSPINKFLVSLMMQMRQKNLYVIIVLPTFFLLDKYAAMFRTQVLFHIYETKGGNRGYWLAYNQKKKKDLFLYGKLTYSYSKNVYTRFKGRFYGAFALGDKEVVKEYRKKKEVALQKTETTEMSKGQIKYMNQRDVLLYLFKKNTKFTYKEISEMMKKYDCDITREGLTMIAQKFGEPEAIADKIEEERLRNLQKNLEEEEKEENFDE